MAINRELNNKVAELFHRLLSERAVNSQVDFCKRIDLETSSFNHILNHKRNFPKSKIPILVHVFGLGNDYFKETRYAGEEDICSKILFVRKILGLTQADFSKKLGISQQTISAIEGHTNTQPSYNILWGLINVFKVNPYFLFAKDQVVFDSGKKFSNRSKVDNIVSYAKRIIEESNNISL